MSQETLDFVLENKVIAIVRGISSEKMIDLVHAMVKGGVRCVEVTFDQSSEQARQDTLESIRAIATEFAGEVSVGAGTVMDVEQVRAAAEAGAQYIISPNADESVIRETKALGLVSIPGAMTPTEIANAYAWGADIVKVFPAGVLGPAYIKAVRAPLNHIPMVAVGGVSPDNIADFIAVGCVGAGCGGNLVSKKLVDEGRFSEITRTALAYKAALAK